MNTDHVVMQGNEFVCLNCGRRYALRRWFNKLTRKVN